MKVRNIKHRRTWYGDSLGCVGVYPTWKVKPVPGYRWHGNTLVKRK